MLINWGASAQQHIDLYIGITKSGINIYSDRIFLTLKFHLVAACLWSIFSQHFFFQC